VRVREQGGGLEPSVIAAARDQDLLLACAGQAAPGLCAKAGKPLPLLTPAVLLLLPAELMGAGVKVDPADLINYLCSVHPE